MTKEKNGDMSIRRGTGNVFADLGNGDPDTHLFKAQLVIRIDEIMSERKLTQVHRSSRPAAKMVK